MLNDNVIREDRRKKRKLIDAIYQSLTYLASAVGVITLAAILIFIFNKGSGLLNWGIITGDYHSIVYNATIDDFEYCNCEKPLSLDEDVYYSNKWGVGFKDSYDREGNSIVVVAYVDVSSPFANMNYKYPTTEKETSQILRLASGNVISQMFFDNGDFSISRQGAEVNILKLDMANGIKEIAYQNLGGGIRGSLITTLYLIILTLSIALPLGVFTAIYLNEFAPNNKITNVLRSLIEMLTGVPSIIFGLMGASVFIPLTSKLTPASGGNLISGSLTLAVILLPVIIRSTEEALKVVPKDLRSVSLALGANHTQTTFKVVLPSAIPGIMTGTLLSIGRIVGESAALIYAVGTAIKDNIILTEKSTSLAVHIWTIMSSEVPNFELASTIAIIILITVLILNILVKYLSKKLNKAWY